MSRDESGERERRTSCTMMCAGRGWDNHVIWDGRARRCGYMGKEAAHEMLLVPEIASVEFSKERGSDAYCWGFKAVRSRFRHGRYRLWIHRAACVTVLKLHLRKV